MMMPRFSRSVRSLETPTARIWSGNVQAARVRVVSPLNLNVVFHVDGRLAPNEFTGVRTGRFSAKAAHLMVQAAVQLGPVEDREEVLMSLLSDAINVAEEFARKKKLADDLAGIRRILAS